MQRNYTGLLVALLLMGAASSAYAEVGVGDHPKLQVVNLDGKALDVSKMHGVVLVDFWATWCAPCRRAFGQYAKMARDFGQDQFHVIAVNIEGDPAKVKHYLAEHPVPFEVVLDPGSKTLARFGPSALPAAYLIGANGTVRYTHMGFDDGDAAVIRKHVKALLGRPTNHE